MWKDKIGDNLNFNFFMWFFIGGRVGGLTLVECGFVSFIFSDVIFQYSVEINKSGLVCEFICH